MKRNPALQNDRCFILVPNLRRGVGAKSPIEFKTSCGHEAFDLKNFAFLQKAILADDALEISELKNCPWLVEVESDFFGHDL